MPYAAAFFFHARGGSVTYVWAAVHKSVDITRVQQTRMHSYAKPEANDQNCLSKNTGILVPTLPEFRFAEKSLDKHITILRVQKRMRVVDEMYDITKR